MGISRPNEGVEVPDKQLAAVCGLFCPACFVYIATTEAPERLKRIAQQRHISEDAAKCYGCRSDNRFPFCQTCKMTTCAAERGFDFCGECEEYPCEELKEFQAARPHRIEIWNAQKRIEEVGYAQWYKEMLKQYSCSQCHTINSAYDLKCRNCGTEPSCDYVSRHKKAIEHHLANQG
jgi:hypothetical protein